MPTQTYTPLANVTLGSSAASVTFSSIPATYRDLIVVIDGKSGTTTNADVRLRPNNDSGNATRVFMFGDGSTTSSQAFTDAIFVATLPPSNSTNASAMAQIMDYPATDKHKTILQRSAVASQFVSANAARWASTSAITSIVLMVTTESMGAGTTLSLYGISA
jgi:hypothetical protein